MLSENGYYSHEVNFVEKKITSSPKGKSQSMDCSKLNYKSCYEITKIWRYNP